MTLFLLYLFRKVYLHILIYIITMPVNLSQYRATEGTFNNRCLICFRNNYQHFKYYLNDINIAFDVISFSCSILRTISIFFLSLSFGIFVSNAIKKILFPRFRRIKGVFVSIFVFLFFVSFFSRRLLLSGDIKTNPGQRHNLNNHFTICRWDLNSIFAHSFAKVQLLEAYLSAQKFDIACFSETYLNSSCPFHDENLDIHGYIKVRVDHLANSKREGVCMYNKSCPDVH